MAEGWISLHRKFLTWEWFEDTNMVKLFIYLLLKANHKPDNWRGISINRGQLLTGLDSLNKDTKISKQTLRTCLKRLENTREINTQVTNKYRIITICNYDSYQDKDKNTNNQSNKQLTINQQATNKQLTANNNVNNVNNTIKEYSNEIKNFTGSILTYFPILPKKLESWYEITDKLTRIDNYDLNTIEIIVKYFRADSFWIDNFQSYTKLRKKKDEGLYIDYFKNILISKNNGANQKNSRRSNTTAEGLNAILDEQFPSEDR